MTRKGAHTEKSPLALRGGRGAGGPPPVAEGKTNDVPHTGAQRLDIVRANVFTRINAILGVLLIIVIDDRVDQRTLFGC